MRMKKDKQKRGSNAEGNRGGGRKRPTNTTGLVKTTKPQTQTDVHTHTLCLTSNHFLRSL